MSRPVRLTVVALALALASAWAWQGHARRVDVQRRASEAASTIAGRPVRVHCPSALQRVFAYDTNDGSVRFSADGRPADETNLAGEVCTGLERLLRHGSALDLSCLQLDACSADDTRVARGVAVLTHESVHMSGVMDEARTECTAVRHSAAVARALGASQQAAAYISDWQFSTADERLPEQYQSTADCRVSQG